jgi:hypothetical protein
MRSPRSPWPQRTTAIAGACVTVAAIVTAAAVLDVGIPVTETFTFWLIGPFWNLLSAVLLAAAWVVLALGVGGEIGIVGTSRLGAAALIVWGARDVVVDLLGLLPWDPEAPGWGAMVIVQVALQLLGAAGAVAAAVVVARTRVLTGWLRRLLAPVAVVEVLEVALSWLPVTDVGATVAFAWWLQVLLVVLLLAFGIGLLLHGRSEAVRHRAQLIKDAW